MSEIVPTSSPFDAIKHVDERGEHWFARELAPLLGYAQWRNFEDRVLSARAAIDLALGEGAGQTNIADASNYAKVGFGSRQVDDFRLTRFGAYMTALECDGSKQAVAEAKAYFATRAREAEVRAASPFQVPRTFAEALELAASQAREIEAKTARMEQAEGTIRQIEGGDGLTLRVFHKKYFSEVGERVFFEHLYAKGYLIDQRGKGAARLDGTIRDGSQHRHPGHKGKRYLYFHFAGVHGDKRRENTRVRPGQPELDFRDALAREGLPVNANDAGHLFAITGGGA